MSPKPRYPTAHYVHFRSWKRWAVNNAKRFNLHGTGDQPGRPTRLLPILLLFGPKALVAELQVVLVCADDSLSCLWLRNYVVMCASMHVRYC